jgi:coat protein Gp5
MVNTTLTASVIAKAAVGILENELNMAGAVHRGYEDEFDKKVNGYEIGDTVTIRKPADFTVRKTIVANPQDVSEGKLTLQINKVAGVDFKFTSQQLTLNIGELSERVIRPAMIQIANAIDVDVFSLYKQIPQWVGTPGGAFDTFKKFSAGARNFDQRSVPNDGGRNMALSPSDFWDIAGAQTALFSPALVEKAFKSGKVGNVAGLDTFMGQNVPTHTVGPLGGAPLINGANQNTAYDLTGVNTQALITDGWTAAAAQRVNVGDVFTIAGVFDVNPVTKAPLPILKQFVVDAASNLNSDGAGNLTLTIAPQIVTTGPFQNVTAAPADNAALTFVGTANTSYAPSLTFHKNAFALAIVPMVRPPGAVDCSRMSKNGISIRIIPFYDGTNDVSNWRCDVIYGIQTVDRRLAVRTSGG